MWYFAWLLGLPLAALFAVMNAMWFEMMEDDLRQKKVHQRCGADSGDLTPR